MNETTRALTISRQLTPSVWEMIQAVAPVMHKSRLFGVTSPETAAAIMLKGHELGLSLTASFEFCHVVMGKPALSPRGALALIHQHSELVQVEIRRSDDTACTVWMKRKDTSFEFEATWTMEDAKRAGVVKADSGWVSYPANMLRWRCIGFVADVVCPDLIGGMKRADELGADIDREGNVIEGEWATVAPPIITAAPAVPVVPTVTLDDLVAQYGADAVFAACGGALPATDEEVQLVGAVLEVGNDA